MIVPWRSPRILSLNVLLVGWKFWVGLQVQSNNNWQHLLAVFAWWYVKNTLLPNYFNQLFCFLVAIWVRIQSFLSLEKKREKKNLACLLYGRLGVESCTVALYFKHNKVICGKVCWRLVPTFLQSAVVCLGWFRKLKVCGSFLEMEWMIRSN